MNYNSIILRNAEIGLKSRRKRPYFERLLSSSLKEALSRHLGGLINVKNLGLRFVIYSQQTSSILPILANVPGVNSFSPTFHFKFSSKEDILDQVKKRTSSLVEGKKFRVSATRMGTHSFSSMSLAKEAADQIYDASDGVDLHNPQITISIEVRNQDCFLYTQSFPGLGGVPARSTGKTLMLFSGGIDSPVAAFQLLKRGCALDYLHVDLVGDSSFAQVIPVYNHIIETYQYNYPPRLFYVNAQKLSTFLVDNVQGDLRQLALKIAFYHLANALCKKEDYFAFATGEALGQKSTQTLPSLSLLEHEADYLVLRPLIDKDKLEITKVAQTIGTWAYSTKVKETCNLTDGPVFAVPHKEDMQKIPDMTSIIDELIANLKVYEGVISQEPILSFPKEFSDFSVIDIRLPAQQAQQTFEDVQSMSFGEAKDLLPSLDISKPVAFICQHGVLGQELAYLFAKRKGKAMVFTPKEFVKFMEGLKK